ncbi:hypothetical protein MNV49_002154 [Pseudohyphozyma bogoriensis]|nr:hypothetical protein MNV49_002154 [Pseudohyphozyma bogoriensis]
MPPSLSLFLHTHLSTTTLNALPPHLLRRVPVSTRPVWDLAAVLVLVAFIAAQVTLVVAVWQAVGTVAWGAEVPSWEAGGLRTLVKRAGGAAGQGAKSTSLLLQPVIPGITTPLSSLPTLLTSLFLSQSFHELGHALAAAAENVPIESIGVHLYFLVLPTFYVSLPPVAEPTTELRIAAAGVFHNGVLLALTWLLSSAGGGLGKLCMKATGVFVGSGGLRVVKVSTMSPLRPYLLPHDLVTTIDDYPLIYPHTSPHSRFTSYLSSPTLQSQTTLGWCIPRAYFTRTISSNRGDCCPFPSSSSSADHEPESPKLCFHHVGTPYQACLDPLPLFPPSEVVPARCQETKDCEGSDGCAMIAEEELVVRLTVGEVGEEKRTVVWQGEKRLLGEQVTVTDVQPRKWFRWLGLGWEPAFEAFYSAIFTLSLTLGFFNLLPLPHLDGTVLLTSFFTSLTASRTTQIFDVSRLEEGMGMAQARPTMLSEVVRRFKWLCRTEAEGQRRIAVLRRWNWAALGVWAACSLAVGLGLRG